MSNAAVTAFNETVRVSIRNIRSFQDVNLLQKAVSRIPGVRAVKTRAEGRGTVTLLVSYDGMVPFTVHLNEMLRRNAGGFSSEVTVEEYELLTPARISALAS